MYNFFYENDIIAKLEIEKSHDTIKKILSKFISLYDVLKLINITAYNKDLIDECEIQIKYEGYLKKQEKEICI